MTKSTRPTQKTPPRGARIAESGPKTTPAIPQHPPELHAQESTGSPFIEVLLTDPKVFHCFKIVFHGKPSPDADHTHPIEIFLHTTQAIDLFTKLAGQLSEYMRRSSATLLTVAESLKLEQASHDAEIRRIAEAVGLAWPATIEEIIKICQARR